MLTADSLRIVIDSSLLIYTLNLILGFEFNSDITGEVHRSS